ncbi:hypothetical protein [Paenibacillus arenilitoris]|uniref:Uncharacterized protein n=1 Tax=Paenibacillus arenilitoris TaxID=2772299 RepID=A0A927CKZ3_9BACL|nr:hypothetical protein [Paenibacillus arenilitoris]MBD2868702.1 hypothetical protein [Paenibacillus arenilitoris]
MKNVKTALFLIISQIIYAVFAAIWALFALLSLTMLDQLDDATALQTISYVVILSYPIVFIGSAIASWLLYHKRKFKKAVWIGLIPVLWSLSLVGFFTP